MKFFFFHVKDKTLQIAFWTEQGPSLSQFSNYCV